VAGTEGLTEVGWWIAEQSRRIVRDLVESQDNRGRKRRKGKDKKMAGNDDREGDDLQIEAQQVVKGYVLMVDVRGAGLSNLVSEQQA
jgi:hypothetical protein